MMSASPRAVLIGGGGHAKAVTNAALAAGWVVEGVLDDALEGEGPGGLPVLGLVDAAEELGLPCLLAVGSAEARQWLSGRIHALWAPALVHPSAVVALTAVLAEGVVVLAGAVIEPDVAIGAHAVVGVRAVVDHDVILGSYAHLSTGCVVGSYCVIGEAAVIPVGTAVSPGTKI